MRVLLIAPDSKIPNLALMLYSSHFKSQGHKVGWKIKDPDLIVASITLAKNAYMPGAWRAFQFPGVKQIVGGPGYDPKIRLPEDIEKLQPDWSLYPDYKDSLGRITIGCIRSCYFCKVPEMGRIRYIKPVWEVYRGGDLTGERPGAVLRS